MKILELFSGTGSVGKVARKKGHTVVSLDLILPADIKADILTWDYKQYEVGHFDVITASPVCLWWSQLRLSNIGKVLKAHPGKPFTREMADADIDKFGKPMVDKVLEIIAYLKPTYYWIENPQTGRMKNYLTLPYFDVDYCKYADWGYKKRTRFWTNIYFKPKTCKKDCGSMSKTHPNRHSKSLGGGTAIDENGNTILLNSKKARDMYRRSGKKYKTDMKVETSKHEKYRIPPLLISELLTQCAY